jgi:hypothetical protein
LKITQDRGVPLRYPDVHRVRCVPGEHKIIFSPKGRIGWGGNGGFHALNLAVQMGLKKIILIGFDMTLQHGLHWHGRHGGSLQNPRQASVDRWRGILDGQAEALAAAGVDVVIGSPGSSLANFRKLDLGRAIDEFHRAI